MYDVHCHMLPGIDDGPQELDEALAMARLAVADGTKVVITTPHATRVVEAGGRSALERQVWTFNQEVQAHAIDLRVVMGAEYMLSMGLLEETKQGTAISLNGSHYLLVEIDFLQYPPHTDEVLFQLQLLGYTPVLAIPSARRTFRRNLSCWLRWWVGES